MQRLAWLVGFALAIAVCVSAAAEEPAQSTLTSSCEGGPGGGSFGVTLYESGRIVRWHRSNFFDDPEEIEQGSDAAWVAEAFSRLDAIGFASIETQEKGEMTCSLDTQGPVGAHRVSWAHGTAAVSDDVRALASRIRERVE